MDDGRVNPCLRRFAEEEDDRRKSDLPMLWLGLIGAEVGLQKKLYYFACKERVDKMMMMILISKVVEAPDEARNITASKQKVVFVKSEEREMYR